MLCGMLADCGAGWPASYYRQLSIPDRCAALGIAFDETDPDFHCTYLKTVRRLGAAGTDLFGARLMWEDVGRLLHVLGAMFPDSTGGRGLLEAAFGPLVFMHLSRADKKAQAASLLRARTNGLWHLAADGSEIERDPPLWGPDDAPDRLEDYIEELTDHDMVWRHWFAEERISPVSLTYEALAADPSGQLRLMLETLGLDPERAVTVQPATAKLPR